MDLSLTCVAATQLWHHTFFGGGLCDLPSWSPSRTKTDGPITLNGSSAHRESISTRN